MSSDPTADYYGFMRLNVFFSCSAKLIYLLATECIVPVPSWRLPLHIIVVNQFDCICEPVLYYYEHVEDGTNYKTNRYKRDLDTRDRNRFPIA